VQSVSVHKLSPVFLKTVTRPQKNHWFYIYVISSGKGIHQVDDRSIDIKPGSLHFVYPHQKQQFTGTKQLTGYSICFTEDFFHLHTEHKDVLFRLPFLGYELKHTAYQLPKRSFDELNALAENMFTEFRQKHIYYDKIILSYIGILLMKCRQLPGAKNEKLHTADYTSLQMVMQYKRLIRQHFVKQHSVSYYAGLLNQTSNYLNIVVKNVTGKTAGELIYDQLIMEAKRLYIHTKLSTKEIAFELGFKDNSYFTKFFRRQTGYRPLDWFRKYK